MFIGIFQNRFQLFNNWFFRVMGNSRHKRLALYRKGRFGTVFFCLDTAAYVLCMTNVQFKKLSLRDQADLIIQNGELITAEDYYSYRVLLYSLNTCYMELVYDFMDDIVSIHRIPAKNVENNITDEPGLLE